MEGADSFSKSLFLPGRGTAVVVLVWPLSRGPARLARYEYVEERGLAGDRVTGDRPQHAESCLTRIIHEALCCNGEMRIISGRARSSLVNVLFQYAFSLITALGPI